MLSCIEDSAHKTDVFVCDCVASFVSLDSGCDSKVTTGNIVRLFVEDKVDAFIGPPCSQGLSNSMKEY